MTVKVAVPIAAAKSTETVRVDVVELPEGGVTEVGLRVAVTLLGAPETERPTAALKPFRDVIVMVEVPEPPWTIVREVGKAEMPKSGGGGNSVTARDKLMLWLKVSLDPVTVRV